MRKIDFGGYVYQLCLILLIFQRALVPFNGLFSYIDEIVAVILLSAYISNILIKKKISKFEARIWLLFFLIIIVGLMGNLLSGYTRKGSLIINSIVFWLKGFIVFLSTYNYFDSKSDSSKKCLKNISNIVKILIIFSTIVLVSSPITKYGIELSSLKVRYGLHAFCFIYPKAAIYSWYCLIYMVILTADQSINKKSNVLFLILNSISWIATLRSRAFAYVGCYWILYFIMLKMDKNKLEKIKKLKLRNIILILIIALLIAFPAIKKYFGNNTTSRYLLLVTGIDIAIDQFPFGDGFSTYGTTASYVDYSPVYIKYGFNKIYALKGAEGGNELVDTYWPAILGEMGFTGLVFMGILVFIIFKFLIKKSRTNQNIYFCIMFFVITTMFSSLVTAVLSSDIMLLYFMIANLACSVSLKREELEE